MKKHILLLSFLLPLLSLAQEPCPDYGNATTQKRKPSIKRRIRRSMFPKHGQAEYLPLKSLLPKKQRPEKDLYWEGAYVYTEGYMTHAKEQGGESCNCGEATTANKDGDVHMYLSVKKNDINDNSMVVEITPLFKKKYPDYKKYMKKNIKIRVYGFLFYDSEHEDAAFTTCNTCGNIWRKTNWEIHPVTKIEIIG